jgi:hypothetical protein
MRAATLVALLVTCASALHAEDPSGPVPGREIGLPKTEIGEDFLGYLVGVIRADLSARLRRADLVRLFPELRALASASSFQLMDTVARQETGDPGHAQLVFTFTRDMHVPVPFGLFGYYPIAINASSVVSLRETRSPVRVIHPRSGTPYALAPDYEYRVVQGSGGMEFDRWLVVLSAGFLDDFTVHSAAVFVYRGDWHGMVVGRSRGGRTIPWLFNLKRMRLVLPLPDGFSDYAELLVAGAP